MSELREPLEHVTTCYKAFGEAFCTLVYAVGVKEGLVEAVEPEEHTCGECGFFPKHTGCRMLPQDIDDDRFYYVEPSAAACENFVAGMEPENTDATIHKLWGKIAGLEAAVRGYESEKHMASLAYVHTELAEAKAEIERLLESRRWWKQRCENTRHNVTRLQGITSAQTPYIEELKGEIKLQRGELAEAKAEIEKLRGQRDAARLHSGDAERELDEAKAEIEKAEAERDYWKRAYLVEQEAWAKIRAHALIGRLVLGMRRGSSLSHPGLVEGWVGLSHIRRQQADNPAEALRAIQEQDDDAR